MQLYQKQVAATVAKLLGYDFKPVIPLGSRFFLLFKIAIMVNEQANLIADEIISLYQQHGGEEYAR